jgi:hypothetical protein
MNPNIGGKETPMALFFMVVAVSACVLGLAFTGIYFLNRSIDRADRT